MFSRVIPLNSANCLSEFADGWSLCGSSGVLAASGS